jgi:hypothetical protein
MARGVTVKLVGGALRALLLISLSVPFFLLFLLWCALQLLDDDGASGNHG